MIIRMQQNKRQLMETQTAPNFLQVVWQFLFIFQIHKPLVRTSTEIPYLHKKFQMPEYSLQHYVNKHFKPK